MELVIIIGVAIGAFGLGYGIREQRDAYRIEQLEEKTMLLKMSRDDARHELESTLREYDRLLEDVGLPPRIPGD